MSLRALEEEAASTSSDSAKKKIEETGFGDSGGDKQVENFEEIAAAYAGRTCLVRPVFECLYRAAQRY